MHGHAIYYAWVLKDSAGKKSICNAVQITPACSKLMHRLCTRHQNMMHRDYAQIMHGRALQFWTDYTRVLENYARIMHTPQNIMHGDYAWIMHGRAIDYARVLKDYAEVFAILDGLHTRATNLCTDYTHVTK